LYIFLGIFQILDRVWERNSTCEIKFVGSNHLIYLESPQSNPQRSPRDVAGNEGIEEESSLGWQGDSEEWSQQGGHTIYSNEVRQRS
jgi:hypothetical protein